MRPSPSERNPDVAIERLLHGVHGGILLFVGHCRLLQLMERLMVMVGMSMSGTPASAQSTSARRMIWLM